MSDDSPLGVREVTPDGQPVRRSLAVRVVRWLGRHPGLVVLSLVVLVPLALGLDWWFLPNRPTLNAGKVESITVTLPKYDPNPGYPGHGQEAATITTDDPALIQPLLDVFRRAKRGEEHKCGSSGTITIRRKDGDVEELHILPGHDERYYEYRFGGRMNRVSREPFPGGAPGDRSDRDQDGPAVMSRRGPVGFISLPFRTQFGKTLRGRRPRFRRSG
jgi:hypothetical protein